ncbi:immunoglobulin-like protein involved in spore germination [Kribbella voronezhensis]|uniref:Immunoglobulin-like protein involved in spore germination n=1 Tax=Kribbella voronezhensis TaxID=2512212 RepID=A0A4R7T6G4_9ACTN|nr:Gmad2 immunoglobulin-like domain-containing protein [Kribbella voronezhensis]TDU87472.1 immunoglobulin-like protein involved in spore germination [Kribbella voronezhensis]
MNDPDDRFDELMRRALADEADRIEPADRLHEIQSRVRSERKVGTRRPWMIAAGAAVVGTAAAIGAFTMLGDDVRNTGEPEVAGPPATTSATTSSTTGPATTSPSQAPQPTTPGPSDQPSVAKDRSTTEPSVKRKAVSVYWLGKSTGNDSGVGVRLYRTFVPVSGRPALEAVRVMASGKSDDPDYYSLWQDATPVSVTQYDGVVTVDFKTYPRQKLETGMAQVAVQQLVYTVQGALGDQTAQVRVTQQGRSGVPLFGLVDTRQPFSRAQAADVQALVWINSPTEGTVIRSPLTVEGIAAAFEAVVNWRATNEKTRQVVQGQTTTKQGQGFSPFSFTTKLAPGAWQLDAYLISPQDGRITDLDSKTVIVR